MNIVFKASMTLNDTQRVIGAHTSLPCGCLLRFARQYDAHFRRAWPKEDAHAKAALVLELQKAAATHDHRAHVIGLVTARLKQ